MFTPPGPAAPLPSPFSHFFLPSEPFLGPLQPPLNNHRRHQTFEGKQYAASMLAVGVAATAYHVSSGAPRRLFRKLDYYSIAASSSFMMKALWPHRPWVRHSVTAISLAIPFKPFVISLGHTLAMQAEYARQALRHEAVRPHFCMHTAAAAAGIVAFAVEDVLAERGFGHVHGLWHCLAAAGVATTGALVEHKERLRMDAAAAGTPKLRIRAFHDSVASLDALGGGSPKSV